MSHEPYLVFRRTGRTIAAVLAFGFGGGTVLLGVLSSVVGAVSAAAIWAAARGYFFASFPFFLGALVLVRCRRELWFVPGARAFRMLTFRPWQLAGPRVEEAKLEDFHAVRTEVFEQVGEAASTVVSLVMASGDAVPVREFDAPDEARRAAAELAEITGLPMFGDAAT
ncbi:MAG: hypothetical protein FJ095_08730 [Deltaproteobacteria bacterium]|nr:hypothetical protein [Deltaproteobacteria bacterium]